MGEDNLEDAAIQAGKITGVLENNTRQLCRPYVALVQHHSKTSVGSKVNDQNRIAWRPIGNTLNNACRATGLKLVRLKEADG